MTRTRITQTITVNGKHYSSLDELPPEIREAYEKAIAAGPDRTHVTIDRFTVTGKQSENMEYMPAEYRELLKNAAEVRPSSSRTQLVTFAIIMLLMLAYFWFR
jgi:hypothetical protein